MTAPANRAANPANPNRGDEHHDRPMAETKPQVGGGGVAIVTGGTVDPSASYGESLSTFFHTHNALTCRNANTVPRHRADPQQTIHPSQQTIRKASR